MNRKPIFDATRKLLGRGLTQAEVAVMDAAIDEAEGAIIVTAPKPSHKLADPAAFYAAVRKITGALDQVQVDTIERLLTSAAHWPLSWLAYAFATAHHEAGLRPIHEKGGVKYLSKYQGRVDLGNTQPGDGVKYAGRGLVQLTGRINYTNASKFLGVDLVANPDAALEPANAARILVWGMSSGAFTGRDLADCLPDRRGTLTQFIEARRIINGQDRARAIAEHAIKFQDALEAGGWI